LKLQQLLKAGFVLVGGSNKISFRFRRFAFGNETFLQEQIDDGIGRVGSQRRAQRQGSSHSGQYSQPAARNRDIGWLAETVRPLNVST